jgi:hypothetical protein
VTVVLMERVSMDGFSRETEFSYAFECVVNNTRVLEVVVGKEIDLIEKVANIDAAQRVHL